MNYSGIDLRSDNLYIATIDDSVSVAKQQRVQNAVAFELEYFYELPDLHQEATTTP